MLAPHVDRLPLVSSIIINVDQDVDEDWPLEVYDHDGVAHNITLGVGEMVYYESHSVIHGRPFPLNGRFYANVFVHFEALGPRNASEAAADSDLPPYLIPDSSWEPEYRDMHPDGWQALKDPLSAINRGDLHTLKYLLTINPSLAHVDEDGWLPLFAACRKGNLDIVKYLVEKGADVNAAREDEASSTISPLALADRYHGTNSEISRFLRRKGAVLDPLVCLHQNVSEDGTRPSRDPASST